MAFVHLHCHSDYSLLDGVGTCSEYAEIIRKNNDMANYLCITDHGMMAAIPAQTKACSEYNLTPIYGTESYLNDFHGLLEDWSELSDEEKKKVRNNAHLCLWAKNDEGYKNLVRISSDAWINGFYYKPRTNKDFLRKHSEGVIAGSACLAGEIPDYILKDDLEGARSVLNEYRDIFKDFYLEIMLLDMDKQRKVNSGIVQLAQEEQVPIILTNDVHFEAPTDTKIQQVALLIQSREGTISNPAGLQFDAKELWFKTESDLDDYYQEHFTENFSREIYEEAKANTVLLAQSCEDVKLDTNPKLPTLPDAEPKLLNLLETALKEKGLDNPEYRERLNGELAIIKEKGFASYFLIMKEIIDYAKIDMNSIVGPGRGSGPGFLVNYLLNLCTVDPIKYSLLSERFLSPHRGGKYAKLKFTE